MLQHRPLQAGIINGTIYTFDKIGDIFETHVHTEEDNHITIVAFGTIKLIGHPNYEGVEVSAMAGAAPIDWTPGEPHGFIAMTDGATIINIRKK